MSGAAAHGTWPALRGCLWIENTSCASHRSKIRMPSGDEWPAAGAARRARTVVAHEQSRDREEQRCDAGAVTWTQLPVDTRGEPEPPSHGLGPWHPAHATSHLPARRLGRAARLPARGMSGSRTGERPALTSEYGRSSGRLANPESVRNYSRNSGAAREGAGEIFRPKPRPRRGQRNWWCKCLKLLGVRTALQHRPSPLKGH